MNGYAESKIEFYRNGSYEWDLRRIGFCDDFELRRQVSSVWHTTQYWEYSTGNVGIGTCSPEDKLDVHGDSGQLLAAADDFSDVIFSANNISGLPVIEACCDSTVTIGKFGGSNFSVRGSDGCIKSVSLNARAAAFAAMMG